MKKIILTVLFFLGIGMISLIAYIYGDGEDMFYGEASFATDQFKYRNNIRLIDTLLASQKDTIKPDTFSQIDIKTDHFLYPILSNAELSMNDKFAKMKSLRDTFVIKEDSLDKLSSKKSNPLTRKGIQYFCLVWAIYFVFLGFRQFNKHKYRKKSQ